MKLGRVFAILAVTALTVTGVFGQSAADRQLPPDYVSDKCSLFFDGDWGDCCVEHDKAYFFGGTKKERRAADQKLCECVRSKGGRKHRIIAKMMWIGVRIGGVGFLPTPFRWGFGKDWKKPTGQ